MTSKPKGSALTALYSASNAALDEVDQLRADGFPQPLWAESMRTAIGEMGAPDVAENEQPWQKLIRVYAEEIGPTPEPEQALLLKLFKEAGENLPIWPGTCHEVFHSQFRKIDIFENSVDGKEAIVWFLLHLDDFFPRVAAKMWPADNN